MKSSLLILSVAILFIWNTSNPSVYAEVALIGTQFYVSNTEEAFESQQLTAASEESGFGRQYSVIAGLEAMFLRPVGETALGTTLHFNNGAGLSWNSDDTDLDEFNAAVRAWLGLEKAKIGGVRARYWRYQASDMSDNRFLDDAARPVWFSENNELTMYTVDLEFFKRFEYENFLLLGSIGPRFGSIDTNQSFCGLVTGDNLTSQIQSDSRIKGIGPFIALEGKLPSGLTGLHLFLNARGSYLKATGDYKIDAVLNDLSGYVTNSGKLDTDIDLYIFELSGGIEYSHLINSFNSSAYVRFGLEYQNWRSDGSSGKLFESLNSSTNTVTTVGDIKLKLMGFYATIGLRW